MHEEMGAGHAPRWDLLVDPLINDRFEPGSHSIGVPDVTLPISPEGRAIAGFSATGAECLIACEH
jgi:hypothetical protein